MKAGTQIIYVPDHARNVNHPDCEPGFIEDGEVVMGSVCCRFWRKPALKELRTRANGEWVRLHNLVVTNTVPQEQVTRTMKIMHGWMEERK